MDDLNFNNRNIRRIEKAIMKVYGRAEPLSSLGDLKQIKHSLERVVDYQYNVDNTRWFGRRRKPSRTTRRFMRLRDIMYYFDGKMEDFRVIASKVLEKEKI